MLEAYDKEVAIKLQPFDGKHDAGPDAMVYDLRNNMGGAIQ